MVKKKKVSWKVCAQQYATTDEVCWETTGSLLVSQQSSSTESYSCAHTFPDHFLFMDSTGNKSIVYRGFKSMSLAISGDPCKTIPIPMQSLHSLTHTDWQWHCKTSYFIWVNRIFHWAKVKGRSLKGLNYSLVPFAPRAAIKSDFKFTLHFI